MGQKKLPFLLDQLPHSGRWMDSVPESLTRFINRGRAAKRFLVEPETAEHVFGLIFRHPELYESQRAFAKPPFESTYVEFRFDPKLVRPVSGTFLAYAGVLRIGNTATLLTAEEDAIIRVDFNRIEIEESGLRVRFWTGEAPSEADDFRHRIVSFAGMTEVLWLLMHKPKVVRTEQVPTTQKIVKGKLRPVRAHSLLTINLSHRDLEKAIRRTEDRGPNRKHDVRGSWVHIGILKGCTHEWSRVEMPEGKPERWACSRCKGIRVWRKEHVRGDEARGRKTHDYEVKL